MASSLTMKDRFVGCLLGGACGDALGEPVEFKDSDAIFNEYGPLGIRELKATTDSKAVFTDDTQMTLFTAEGLLSTVVSLLSSNVDLHTFRAKDAVPGIHQAYLRWLATQKEESESPLFKEVKDKGMLIKQKELHHRRGPGMTCRINLRNGAVGSYDNKINDSKGCGGIMRVAPCGLIVHSAFHFLSTDEKAELAFKLGCVSASITHTHPSGWLSSGCQAAIISKILSGTSLESAIEETISLLEKEPGKEETLVKMIQAKDLATEFKKKFDDVDRGDSDDVLKQKLVLEHLGKLGRGFIGEEALGVALYCALITQKENDMERALCYAVNHGGDSDSTAAITGNLVGALYGEGGIPTKWRETVEMSGLIREVCEDLLNVADPDYQQQLLVKYPPAITVHNGQEYYLNKENLVPRPFRMPAGSKFFDWANSTDKRTLPW